MLLAVLEEPGTVRAFLAVGAGGRTAGAPRDSSRCKWAVLVNGFGCAAGCWLLPARPREQIKRQASEVVETVDRRPAANHPAAWRPVLDLRRRPAARWCSARRQEEPFGRGRLEA